MFLIYLALLVLCSFKTFTQVLWNDSFIVSELVGSSYEFEQRRVWWQCLNVMSFTYHNLPLWYHWYITICVDFSQLLRTFYWCAFLHRVILSTLLLFPLFCQTGSHPNTIHTLKSEIHISPVCQLYPGLYLCTESFVPDWSWSLFVYVCILPVPCIYLCGYLLSAY